MDQMAVKSGKPPLEGKKRCVCLPSKFELKPITISAAILKHQEILHQKSLRPESLKQTQLFLSYLVKEYGNEFVQSVSSSHLEKIFKKRNWQRSTIDRVIAKISPFFSRLIREVCNNRLKI